MTTPDTNQSAAGGRQEGLHPTWQARFRFFQAHGTPGMWKNDRDYRAALAALPYRQRMRIVFNGFAFFFGAFYLAYLGMWRKAIGLLAIASALSAASVLLGLSSTVVVAWSAGLCGYVAARANSLYYEHWVLGRNTWGL
ncbi:DUF2628 domain-containing protein [Rhodococcus sp. (in: high G+C Gram-positive bacteria)]|uniref:DUF2628 domain-containing protein n=1 Tax=Rhodococcus sp. TaxID=1831 RepID=UPI003B8A6653